MLRIIDIKGLTGKFQIPSFPLTDNEDLTVHFKVHETRFGRYIVIVKHGNLQKTFALTPKEMTITLTPNWIKAGGLDPVYFLLEFRDGAADKVKISNDPKKGGFFIEPLYITRVEGNTTGIAWLAKVETELAQLKETVTAQGIKLDEVPTLVKNAQNAAVLEATGYDPLNG